MSDGVQDLRTDVAHGARIYDYILGGKDNYAVDRAAAEASKQVWPALPVHMRANREFMHRAGRFLATECGIDQFLADEARLARPPAAAEEEVHALVDRIVVALGAVHCRERLEVPHVDPDPDLLHRLPARRGVRRLVGLDVACRGRRPVPVAEPGALAQLQQHLPARPVVTEQVHVRGRDDAEAHSHEPRPPKLDR